LEVNQEKKPKGTTKAELISNKRKKQTAINCAASKACSIKNATSAGHRVKKGTYEKISRRLKRNST
jgi:hypothetical protein